MSSAPAPLVARRLPALGSSAALLALARLRVVLLAAALLSGLWAPCVTVGTICLIVVYPYMLLPLQPRCRHIMLCDDLTTYMLVAAIASARHFASVNPAQAGRGCKFSTRNTDFRYALIQIPMF
jgi:hypothetical protein